MSANKAVTPQQYAGETPSRRRTVDFFVVVAADKVKYHQLIKKAIKKLGLNHMVSSVFNGEQLLSLLLKKDFYHTEHAGEPDVILLDLTMPVMDGVEVLRNIRENPELNGLKVWVLNEHSDKLQVQAAEDLGVEGFTELPFTEEKILAALHQIRAAR